MEQNSKRVVDTIDEAELVTFKRSKIWKAIEEHLEARTEQATHLLRTAPKDSTVIVVGTNPQIIYGIEHWQGVLDEVVTMKHIIDSMIAFKKGDLSEEQLNAMEVNYGR